MSGYTWFFGMNGGMSKCFLKDGRRNRARRHLEKESSLRVDNVESSRMSCDSSQAVRPDETAGYRVSQLLRLKCE